MENKNNDLIKPSCFSSFPAISSRLFSRRLPLCSHADDKGYFAQQFRTDLCSIQALWRRQVKTPNQDNPHTYLFLLLVEVVNNNTNKEIQSEE